MRDKIQSFKIISFTTKTTVTVDEKIRILNEIFELSVSIKARLNEAFKDQVKRARLDPDPMAIWRCDAHASEMHLKELTDRITDEVMKGEYWFDINDALAIINYAKAQSHDIYVPGIRPFFATRGIVRLLVVSLF